MENETVTRVSTSTKGNNNRQEFYENQSYGNIVSSNNNDKLYFISTENYRPFVQGDGKNFIVLFDELHYGDSGNYEAKALSNSDVILCFILNS